MGKTVPRRRAYQRPMLAALSLLAAIAIGPERTPPVSATVPASAMTTVAAPIGPNFIVAWTTPHAVFAQIIDGASGRPKSDQPTTVAILPMTSSGLAIASLGDTALIAWDSGYALLGDDAHSRMVAALPARAVAVAAFGGRYLLLRSVEFDSIDARFIDATTGATIGAPFPLANFGAAELAVASNGTNALAISTDRRTIAASASFLIGADGSVKAASSPGFTNAAAASSSVYAQALHIVWDGVSYVATWVESDVSGTYPTLLGCRVVAWDAQGVSRGDGTTLDAFPFETTLTGGGLVANGAGSTLFAPDGHYRRLAGSGAPIDTVWQSLDQANTIGCAAFNKRYLVLERGVLDGTLTTLTDLAPVEALARVAPAQSAPSIASGDTLLFAAWIEPEGAFVARLHDGDFIDSRVTIGTPLEPIALTIAANGDTAAAFVNANQTLGGTMIDAEARASRWFFIASQGAGCTMSLHNAVPLSGGRFLGLWSVYCIGWPFQSPFVQATAFAFTGSGPAATTTIVTNIASAAPYHGGALVADSFTELDVFRFDPDLKMIGTPFFLASRMTPSISIATDGADHAMVTTYGAVYAVDLSTRAVKKTAWPQLRSSEVAWTGSEFVVVASDLTIASFAADGTMIGQPFSVATPFPAHDVHVTSGPAGTAVVYARSGLDTGAGDVDRIFVRRISEAPRHQRAARR